MNNQNATFYEGLVNNNPANSVSPAQPDPLTQPVTDNLGNPLVLYYNDFTQFTAAQSVESNCAEITFFNDGTATLNVQGRLYPPGTGIAYSGNQNELDVTRYIIKFSGAGTRICSVWRKMFYLKKAGVSL